MKKLLLTFSLAAMLLSAKAQIIITGIMADPSGTDASASVGIKAYEYAQFKATQNIDFSVTPYSVVFLYETTTTPLPDLGWASGSQGLTFQFSLTSGTVSKGEFFYVGGDGQKIWGSTSTDISSSKWIRSFDYAKVAGDNSNGVVKTALLGNSTRANGIAVFSGTNVLESSIPLDVIFFGSVGTNHYSAGPPEKGYRITNNDFFAVSSGEFFNKGTNVNTIALSAAADLGKFIKFGGDFNSTTGTWNSPRVATLVTLTNASTISDIETGVGITTLPVSLTNFTAKANKQGSINLAWSTASEQNNSHFEITRSADGKAFSKIDQVAGANNSSSIKNYSYTDANPIAGVNYYQLKQVDFDGTSALSKVVSAKAGLGTNNLTVAISANKSSIKANYNALSSGKATFAVYTVSGAKVSSVEQNVTAGNNQVDLAVSLGNSLHILKVTQGTESISVKF
ncbi:hypothetical protein [Nubsella zeaxanthinifaciens]|uniref:hypothetical protein n=1 Tax=Nubsella zeaxanthinifaciens TaxID=392412 RepID=UPI000DE4EDF4|nr:hypothetical protein [Nubsella zeaxanthinifaciens]